MTDSELEALKKQIYEHFGVDEKLVNTAESQRLYAHYMEKNFGSVDRNEFHEKRFNIPFDLPIENIPMTIDDIKEQIWEEQ